MALLIEAGQMTASDYVPIYPDLPLASERAATDAIRSDFHCPAMGEPPGGVDDILLVANVFN
jgi:hypothetical protein